MGVRAFRLGAAFLIDHRLDGAERDFHIGDFAHRVVGGESARFRSDHYEVTLSRKQPRAKDFEFFFHGRYLASGWSLHNGIPAQLNQLAKRRHYNVRPEV